MFKQIFIVLMLSTVFSRMEVFGRALNINEEYLPGQAMKQENPTQTRNKRFLDDLLDVMIDYLFEYDDENDYYSNDNDNDGVQDGICRNCTLIVNNINHFNLPTLSPVGKPAVNKDKTETPTGTPNPEGTQNPNTQTTKPTAEETKTTAATNQVAGEPTTASTPKVVDETTIKPIAEGDNIPVESKPEAVEDSKGAEM